MFSPGGGESKSRARGVGQMLDWISLKTSSPVDDMEILWEIAISRAVSSAVSHSCAIAVVADPSDEATLGSSKVMCLSC